MSSGDYLGLGQSAWFWTSSIGSLSFNGIGAGGTSNAWNLTLMNNNANANLAGSNIGHAMSLRCIKNIDATSPSVPVNVSGSIPTLVPLPASPSSPNYPPFE